MEGGWRGGHAWGTHVRTYTHIGRYTPIVGGAGRRGRALASSAVVRLHERARPLLTAECARPEGHACTCARRRRTRQRPRLAKHASTPLCPPPGPYPAAQQVLAGACNLRHQLLRQAKAEPQVYREGWAAAAAATAADEVAAAAGEGASGGGGGSGAGAAAQVVRRRRALQQLQLLQLLLLLRRL